MKKILLAISDKDTLRLLKAKLSKERYYTLLADSGERALEQARAERPIMVITDTSLPGLDGYEVCRQIRRQPQLSHTLVILLTAFGEELKFQEGLEREADDYFLKPVDLTKMIARIKVLIRRNERKNGRIKLTNLPGRALVEREIKRRIDWEEKFALCALNLDLFRAYNEVYGFDLGDRAILILAEILTEVKKKMKPKAFFLGHMNADNFIVMLSLDHMEKYCQEIIRRFEQRRPELYTQSDLKRGYIVTADKTGRMRRFSLMVISIGIITPELQSFKNWQETLDAALWAMHKAKMRGGSNYYLRRDGPVGLMNARKGGRSKRILVVDNGSLSRRLLRSKLEREGYAVRTATTDQEAKEIVRQEPPDLIFLDDTLPEVDGYQTVFRLKRNARTATIPLVMLTAKVNGERARLAGVDDYLVKPYSFEHLMKKVEKYLE